MMANKQCSKCNKDLPVNDFYRGRASCKSCFKTQVNGTPAKAKTTVIKSTITPPKKRNKTPKKPAKRNTPTTTDISFGARSDVERYIAEQILKDIQGLDDLIQTYQELVDSSDNRKEQKDYAAKIETATAKRIDLNLKLIKAFDLFADLGKPIEDNPLYTPVHFTLNLAMPASCIVTNKFAPEPDEIQPVIPEDKPSNE